MQIVSLPKMTDYLSHKKCCESGMIDIGLPDAISQMTKKCVPSLGIKPTFLGLPVQCNIE